MLSRYIYYILTGPMALLHMNMSLSPHLSATAAMSPPSQARPRPSTLATCGPASEGWQLYSEM